MPGYRSIEDAAAAALARINSQPGSTGREYIALIYEDPDTGEFLFSDPQTQAGARGRSEAKGRFKIPKGSLRALIHNHPVGDDDSGLLSEQDVMMARQLGVPSFIGVGDTLLRFTGKTRIGRSRDRVGLTEEVLAQIPIQEIVRRREALTGLLGPPPELPQAVAGLLSPNLGR